MTDLLCHLAWMEKYRGEDDVEAGGFSYVQETGDAHECRNFEADAETGLVYGYVQAQNGTINIDRLGADKNDGSVTGPRIIFSATHPVTGERLVVGYYLNAKVFRRHQTGVRHLPGKEDQMIEHSFEVEAENAILIEVGNRSLEVPHHDGKGLPGQAIVFFPADSERPEMAKFLNDFDHFVGTTPTRRAQPSLRSSAEAGGWPTTPDIERNRRVEQAAINAVRSHFENKEVIDRQAHNCGWDLEFVTPEYKYCIEVKGNSGNQPKAELSENEYRAMRQVMAGEFDGGKYRLAIVTDALSLPKLYLFAFQSGDQWKCELTGREITCEEKTRARLG